MKTYNDLMEQSEGDEDIEDEDGEDLQEEEGLGSYEDTEDEEE